jgi:hypothetical protein
MDILRVRSKLETLNLAIVAGVYMQKRGRTLLREWQPALASAKVSRANA